jgi:hypothetical protein
MRVLCVLLSIYLSQLTQANPLESAVHDRAQAQALDLAKHAIALRSVRGPGFAVRYGTHPDSMCQRTVS